MRRSDTAPEAVRACGQAALAAFDEALSHAPAKEGHALSAATRRLSQFRDALIACQRESGATAASSSGLQTVNGVISLCLAAQFPLGDIPWPAIKQGRDALAQILADGGLGSQAASCDCTLARDGFRAEP